MNAKITIVVGTTLAALLSLSMTSCFRSYLNAAKTSEARVNIGSISHAAAMAFTRERMPTTIAAGGPVEASQNTLCKSATKKIPASAAEIKGKKYLASPTDWTSDPPDTGFTCLKYSFDAPQYYMYNYTMSGTGSHDGDSYSVTAEGDLNGDGVLSKFELKGKVSGENVVEDLKIAETNPTE